MSPCPAEAVITSYSIHYTKLYEARDSDRRLILEQELAGEQRKLEQARKELAEQEAVRGGNSAERTAPYRDRVAVHERNLQAIQKELSGLR